MSEPSSTPKAGLHIRWDRVLIVLATAAVTVGITMLLLNIFERKEEARNPYIRFVDVTEETTDPEPWGLNWPREYDTYKKTSEPTSTKYGGHGGSEAVPREKAEESPWLPRAFAGYAFAIDYRDRRGHAYMLQDQEQTKRVTEKPQPGSCMQCHTSIIPTYRRIGEGDVMKGFEAVCKMTYQQAHEEVVKTGSVNPVIEGTAQVKKHFEGAHPVSCVDCHDARTMHLRVTRPGFIRGIAALMASKGIPNYDPNRDATRQEMRTFVCAQCHVEYYCGPKTTLFYPWNNGLKVEQIEAYYDSYKFPDGHRFYDWKHAETGAELLKAQHPEFELYSQGVHARAGVACADCHMPYERQGALKVSDHWVRSPLLNIARACQTCHPVPEEEIKFRAEAIQERNHALLQRGGAALIDMLDTIKLAKAAGVTEEQLQPALELHRKAQWRLDFIAAENSMGFHAPQEAARILGEAIDYARQGQITALKLIPPPKSATSAAMAR
ncbi:MAG TPA: ammonia-forming cytochrome c nitrite reductase subunit c552 [Phycisphaerae bacterium]|nr:ammonia-forming cytochrome c nitrite reductase subunit c552 [Phycisphaerae bacterium]